MTLLKCSIKTFQSLLELVFVYEKYDSHYFLPSKLSATASPWCGWLARPGAVYILLVVLVLDPPATGNFKQYRRVCLVCNIRSRLG